MKVISKSYLNLLICLIVLFLLRIYENKCQSQTIIIMYYISSCASDDPDHGLVIVLQTALLVSCSLALTQAVILGHDRGSVHKALNACWLYVLNCWCPSLHLYPWMRSHARLLFCSCLTCCILCLTCKSVASVGLWLTHEMAIGF